MGSSKRIVDIPHGRLVDIGYVSASDLARLAYCERQVAFDAQFGCRTSTARRAAQQRGLKAHEAFYREGLSANKPPRNRPDVSSQVTRLARGFCVLVVVAVVLVLLASA